MSRFVRSSKFRHVFGTTPKRDKCYDNIKIAKCPHESNMSSVNAKFLAVVLESQGGGSFIVIPLEKVGRVDINHPKVTGHKAQVLDVMWNPFNDNQIASASEDCTIMIWNIPDGGLSDNLTESDITLEAHQRKVQHIQWHPTAADILASAGGDYAIFVWNTGTGDILMECTACTDLIQSISWDYNGSHLAATCKDKKIRVIDAHTGDVTAEGEGHCGTKPSRAVFCGKTNKLFSTGFSRMSERQYALWDPSDMSKSLAMENIDSSSGVLFPFWDEGTNMVYLVGKGDTQIRLFEVVNDKPCVFFLNMYQAKEPQRSACAMPKRHLDYMNCEVMRFFKLNPKGLVEPIPMVVPRKSDMFQEDIYPDCPSGEAALTAEEWASGNDKDPLLIAIKGGSGSSGGSSRVSKTKSATTKTATAKTATTVKKTTPQPQSVTASSPAQESVSNLAGRPTPTTLEEYRKAYKELEEENHRLKEKLGMAV